MPKRSSTKATKSSKESKRSAELALIVQPADFFKEKVDTALEKQKIRTNPNTAFYLVDLLSRFMLSKNLFAVDENGESRQEVLALLLGQALSADDPQQKHRGLRRLGDISLYTAGFFADSLARKVVDVDYYIGMGRNAYTSLASLGLDTQNQTVFSELARQFHRFVDVLAEVSESSGTKDPKNLLRLYEVWLKTRSERAERSLKEAGIIPNVALKREWQ